jgi:hypothetical protein
LRISRNRVPAAHPESRPRITSRWKSSADCRLNTLESLHDDYGTVPRLRISEAIRVGIPFR